MTQREQYDVCVVEAVRRLTGIVIYETGDDPPDQMRLTYRVRLDHAHVSQGQVTAAVRDVLPATADVDWYDDMLVVTVP